MKLKIVNSLGIILVFYNQWKNDVRFDYVPWKMSDFVTFSLFGLTVVIQEISLERTYSQKVSFNSRRNAI